MTIFCKKLKKINRKIVDWKFSKDVVLSKEDLDVHTAFLEKAARNQESISYDEEPPEFKADGLYIVLEGSCSLEDKALKVPQELGII